MCGAADAEHLGVGSEGRLSDTEAIRTGVKCRLIEERPLWAFCW